MNPFYMVFCGHTCAELVALIERFLGAAPQLHGFNVEQQNKLSALHEH